jgi:thiol-disulfide isomerase/thioredoxin
MSPIVGDPDGRVTVVEFFDYNCPYCRAAGPMLTELLQRKPDIRIVYKEFPTLAASSRSRRRRRSPPAVRARNSIRGPVRLTCGEQKRARRRMCDHAAATASRHWFAASARKIRSVERETRWR